MHPGGLPAETEELVQDWFAVSGLETSDVCRWPPKDPAASADPSPRSRAYDLVVVAVEDELWAAAHRVRPGGRLLALGRVVDDAARLRLHAALVAWDPGSQGFSLVRFDDLSATGGEGSWWRLVYIRALHDGRAR